MPAASPSATSARRATRRLLAPALRLAVVAAVAALAAGCARLPVRWLERYPAVGLPVGHVVGPEGDTLWTRRVGVVTLMATAPSPLDSPFVVLESAPAIHERLLGRPAPPATAVMLHAPRKDAPRPRRPALPDSMRNAPVVWAWYIVGDTVAREGTTDGIASPPSAGRPIRRGRVFARLPRAGLPDSAPTMLVDPGHIFPVEFYVAQHWVDADAAAHGRLPAWLEAGIVAAIAEGTLRTRPALLDRGLRDAPPLDSLFRRTCKPGWKAIPGEPASGLFTLTENPPERLAWLPWIRERCGARLRVQAYSLLAFLTETAGAEVMQAFAVDARAGRAVEATLARYPSLPSTREGLDDAWRRWVLEWERATLYKDEVRP